MAAHELLHHTILERMKTDHREPSVRRQALERGVERGFELREFAIDVDAQRLKHAGRRMLVALAGARPRATRSINPASCERALEGPQLAVGDDGARDARRLALLAELAKDADQFGLGRAVDDVGRAHAFALAHAHVERPIVHEAEAALRRRRAAARRRPDRTECRRI